MDACQRLGQWWETSFSNIVIEPTPIESIKSLEQRYNLRIPKDFEDYLLKSCPSKESFDVNNTAWWQFDRIKNIPDEYKHKITDPKIEIFSPKYLFFADYSIWCWAWAIACTDDDDWGRVALIGGLPDRFVASSFTEFVERYINDFGSVC